MITPLYVQPFGLNRPIDLNITTTNLTTINVKIHVHATFHISTYLNILITCSVWYIYMCEFRKQWLAKFMSLSNFLHTGVIQYQNRYPHHNNTHLGLLLKVVAIDSSRRARQHVHLSASNHVRIALFLETQLSFLFSVHL